MPDFPQIPDFVRESVKSTILNEAARDDSRLWRSELNTVKTPYSVNDLGDGSSGSHSIMNGLGNSNNNNNSVNESTSSSSSTTAACDPLDDLYLTAPTRYWPGLPPGIQQRNNNNGNNAAADDPFGIAKAELSRLAASIREDLIGTDHPVLNQAASYFFDSAVSADGGKKVRPMMVLLLSRALADSAGAAATSNNSNTAIAVEFPPPPLLAFEHQQQQQQQQGTTASQQQLFTAPLPWQRQDLPAAQRRLAEISEMIHTASLFHDDVIDGADTRRGVPAVHEVFGNKMAILAGDYLLARASICLARLRHVEVVETMSTIIEHLVRGEVMQLRGSSTTTTGASSLERRISERLHYYLRKNFYKTGSLMANSCKSAALLGDYPAELVDASYRYGKHVGMAFQLVDDVLDFEGTLSQMGKPALSDLKAGLATAPVLFAAEEYPELESLIDRRFKEEGDVDRAVDLVFASSGMERTKELARVHAEYAMDALLALHPSENRDALVHLANKVVARTK